LALPFSILVLTAIFFGLDFSRKKLDAEPRPYADDRLTPRGARSDTRFSTAATEWRTAGAAVGTVMNRWQCDPRYSFFALGNDMREGNAAVLWSKRLYPGDVTVEFFFGIQMDHLRGNPFQYARDVNVTIGSDGSDLRKGCTFSFGGHGNTCSYIARDGVEIE